MRDFHFSPRPNRADQIRWRPWGSAAFKAAKDETKPVLLGISAVWCHWCHVMDETTYSDSAVINLINDHFVSIRVDNDRRPDVNARYNMGGWPTTAVLSPEGEILFGGTYLPPDDMRHVLEQIRSLYADAQSRLSLTSRIQELRAARSARSLTPRGGELDPATARSLLDSIGKEYDARFGGFGQEQKFPHVAVLQFLLDHCARTDDPGTRSIITTTLHAMAGGGMYDRVFGGFFRYSTTPDFSVPHFEKMLEDLAGLLWVCARAGAMFDDPGLRAVAIDVKRYMDEHLWNARWHGYGGSQDADEAYYSRSATGRAGLFYHYVYTFIYTAWNAHAAIALLAGASLLRVQLPDAAEWERRALEILEHAWSDARVDGLMLRYYDGAPHVRGLLVDQSWTLRALLQAFATTGRPEWLGRAGQLIASLETLYDPTAETYVDRAQTGDDPGRVSDPAAPFEENAQLARSLLDLAALRGDDAPAGRARAMLKRYAEHYDSYGLFAAAYGSAVLDVFAPPVDVHIVGPPAEPASHALRERALSMATPLLRVDPLDPQADSSRLASLGYDARPGVAYLCHGRSCFARVTDPGELTQALQRACAAAQRSVTSNHSSAERNASTANDGRRDPREWDSPG